MNDIAEEGEEVLYTGYIPKDTYGSTRNLMVDHLITGNYYIVCDVCDNKSYYRVKGFWAPCESFKRDTRKYYKEKYNLR